MRPGLTSRMRQSSRPLAYLMGMKAQEEAGQRESTAKALQRWVSLRDAEDIDFMSNSNVWPWCAREQLWICSLPGEDLLEDRGMATGFHPIAGTVLACENYPRYAHITCNLDSFLYQSSQCVFCGLRSLCCAADRYELICFLCESCCVWHAKSFHAPHLPQMGFR